MDIFQPKIELYGREVIGYFENNVSHEEKPLGKLEEIRGPHLFLIGGKEWEINSSDDFGENKDGTLFLNWPW